MLNREAVNAILLARKMMQEGGEASVEDVADPYEERASDQIEYMPEAARIAYEPSVTPTSAIDYTLGSSGGFTPPPSAPDPFEERATQAIDYVRPAPDPYEQRATQAIDYVQPAPDPYEERTKESLADRALRVISTQPQPTRAPAPAASRSPAPAAAPAKQGFLDRIFSGPQYQSTGQQVVQNGQVNWGDAQNAADFFRADKAMQEAMKKASAAAPARSPEPRTQAAGYARPVPEQRSAALAAIGRQVPGEGEMRRPFFDVPFLAGDLSKASTYARASEPLAAVNGIVFHHTAGRGKPEDIINVLNQRGLGVQFVMDRDGSIYQALPNGARGAHMRPSQVVPLDNSNAIGVEMIARDNDDVTPEQVAAARQLFDALRKQYPNIQPWGHGEVNPHKMSTEGMAAVSAIRSAYDIQPTFQNVRRAAPPMGARTLRGYQTGDYAEGGRVPLLSDQHPTSYLPNVGRQVMQEGGVPNETVALAQQVMSADPMGSVTMAGAPATEGTSIIETTPPVDQTVERAEQVMREYTPTTREKIKAAIAGYDVGKPSPERARFAEGIAAMVPGIALEDAARRAQAGQPGQAALEVLNAVPGPVTGGVASAALQKVAKNVMPTAFGKFNIPRSPELTPTQRSAETHLAEKIEAMPERVVAEYKSIPGTDGGRKIDTDLAREVSHEYSASKVAKGEFAPATHEPASWLVKKVYTERLAEPVNKTAGYLDHVLFTAGGAGSGKTSAIQDIPRVRALEEKSHVVYDSLLSSAKSAQEKIDQALNAGKQVTVAYVYRDPMESFVNGVLPRAKETGRAVPIDSFLAGHKNSAKTVNELAEIYKNNPAVRIEVIDNSHGFGKARAGTSDLIDPSKINVTANDLRAALEQEYRAGRVTDSVYQATLGKQKPAKRAGGIVNSALKLSSQFGPGAAQEAVRSLKQRPGRR